MFNVGTQELLLILLIALIVVGPQKLPELSRSIGRALREFRRMQDEVKDMVKVDLNPEPPAVHEPRVSGAKPARQPHRSPRPASASSGNGGSAQAVGDGPVGNGPVGESMAADEGLGAGGASDPAALAAASDAPELPPHGADVDAPDDDDADRDGPSDAAGAG